MSIPALRHNTRITSLRKPVLTKTLPASSIIRSLESPRRACFDIPETPYHHFKQIVKKVNYPTRSIHVKGYHHNQSESLVEYQCTQRGRMHVMYTALLGRQMLSVKVFFRIEFNAMIFSFLKGRTTRKVKRLLFSISPVLGGFIGYNTHRQCSVLLDCIAETTWILKGT